MIEHLDHYDKKQFTWQFVDDIEAKYPNMPKSNLEIFRNDLFTCATASLFHQIQDHLDNYLLQNQLYCIVFQPVVHLQSETGYEKAHGTLYKQTATLYLLNKS